MKSLRDCVEVWPPQCAASVGHDSPMLRDTDLIRRARVSNDGRLVLSLRRGEREFASTVRIREQYREHAERLAPDLAGHTVSDAGAVEVDDRD